jgi:hypothetical protein
VSYAVNLPTPTTCPDDELRPIQALSQAPTLAPILGVNAEADPSAICPVDARAVMVREALAAIPDGLKVRTGRSTRGATPKDLIFCVHVACCFIPRTALALRGPVRS